MKNNFFIPSVNLFNEFMRLLYFILLILACGVIGEAQERVLIFTRNGKGYVHDNIPAASVALKKLCLEYGYVADVTDDTAVFTETGLKVYKCLIFANTNNEAFDSQTQKDALVKYIRNGGGFVGIHSASGSERQWPWFSAMVGGKFLRHPALQKFTIKTINKDHPATSFLDDSWEWEDECYFTNQLNPDIRVLLAVDLTTLNDDKKSEYPGNTFGNYFPLAWYHEFEGGREFYTSLGHKSEYYSNETFLRHLWGGISWAMGVK